MQVQKVVEKFIETSELGNLLMQVKSTLYTAIEIIKFCVIIRTCLN